MRMIPTRVHAVLDYVEAAVLILVPLAWFNVTPIGAWVPIVGGFFVLFYSLFTSYEYSIANIIPMPVHLLLDGIVSALLLISPWLFGFGNEIWIPHVVLGILGLLSAGFTKARPGAVNTRGARHSNPVRDTTAPGEQPAPSTR